MVADPPATPVSTPVEPTIVAIVGFRLVHVPPPDPSVSVIVDPTQTVVGPAIDNGNGFTFTVTGLVQPVVAV